MLEAKKRILFVDDEPKILRGLKRSLKTLTDEWELAFAESGPEALGMMAIDSFEVIVSDMRMPGMDGAELLNKVRERYPHMIRLALSGEAAKESVLNSIGPIHQYLPKPCDVETLQSTLWRLCSLQHLLSIRKIQTLLAEMEKLPSLPSMYHRLIQEFESPDGSIKRVGQIVSQDLGMSTKVLQLVNSAFFGTRRRVSCPSEAAIALGMDTVRALALTVCVFAPLESRIVDDFSVEALWRHGLQVGTIAREIARAEQADQQVVDDAFIAGLLHDVGKLAFAAMMPDDYQAVYERYRKEGLGINDAEQKEFRATHAEVGAYLLGLWGFTNPVMQALAFHHHPRHTTLKGFSTVTAVHVANVLAHETETIHWPHSKAEIDVDYLCSLGLLKKIDAWKQVCDLKEVVV